MNRKPCVLRWSAAVALLLGLAGAGVGQNPNTRPVTPYYPGYPGGFYPGPVGGAYLGQAEVIRASGELMIQTEQARIERERSHQEKLVTKKKSFEQMMYERANTATLTENMVYEKNLMTQRLIVAPIPAEITGGKTLNAMVPMIESLARQGMLGPPIAIDPEQSKHLDVTVGKGGPNLGVLKDGGANFNWPFALRGPLQKKIAAQIPTVVSQTKMGTLDPALHRELLTNMSNLNEELRRKSKNDELQPGEYLEAKRFLEPIQPAIVALRQPTAQRFLDGTYTAKGRSVPELANYMTAHGLMFTECNPGEEAAYYAMHDRFMAYTTSAQAAGGFQVKYSPPRTDPFVIKSVPGQK